MYSGWFLAHNAVISTVNLENQLQSGIVTGKRTGSYALTFKSLVPDVSYMTSTSVRFTRQIISSFQPLKDTI